MEDTIINLLVQSGPWALLFGALFIYHIQDSRANIKRIDDGASARELKYQELLNKVTECFPKVSETCERIEIKQDNHIAMVTESLTQLKAQLGARKSAGN